MASTLDDICGYNYTFLENPHHLSKYICAICTLVSRDPQQVTCCGHIYCEFCLFQLKEKSLVFKCPTCTHPLKDGEYFYDKRAQLDINSLRLHCPNVNKEIFMLCNWEGQLNDLDSHLNQSCSLQYITCTEGCGNKVRRGDLNNHLLKECPHWIFYCKYCTYRGYRKDAVHKCPKEVISCEYSTVGCTSSFKREEEEKHNEQYMKEHLRLAVRKVAEHERKQSEMQLAVRKVADVEQKLAKLLVVIEEMDKKLKKEILLEKRDKDYNSRIASLELTLKDLLLGNVWQSELLKMTRVSIYTKQRSCYYYSKKFYLNYYNMYLQVGSDKEQYLSCYIVFTEGNYDDTLEWPFQGEVKIEVLNQLEDKNHIVKSLAFDKSIETRLDIIKPTKSEDTTGYGFPKFIAFTDLGYYQSRRCRYLKDNNLYFRVSSPQCKPVSEKPWLLR